MEETTSIQLQFRTGDDLFNNYGYGIIRQVVDKSEITIHQKKEEMRQLVGSKYLDMIRVSDTMSEMNGEFGIISEAVKNILSMCSSFGDDFVYVEEQANEDDLFITPEILWSYYDNHDMITLCRKLHQYEKQPSTSLDSLYSEMLSDFPRIAAEKCIELIRVNGELSEEELMHLLISFMILINRADVDIDYTIRQFFQIAEEQTASVLGAQSLECILQTIQEISRLFHGLRVLLTSPHLIASFTDLLPSLPEDWNQQAQSALQEISSSWLTSRFAGIEGISAMVVRDVATIAELAEMKRRVASNHQLIAPLWEDSFTTLSIPSEIWSTLLPHLYDHLFSQPSRTLIRSSFQSLQESVGTSVRRLGEYSLQEVNEFLSKWLVKPLSQLFVDLGDLDYQSSDELKTIVEEESLTFFSHIEKVFAEVQVKSSSIYLSYAYTFFLVETSANTLMSTYHVQLTSSITTYHKLFEDCVQRWVDSLLAPEAALNPTFSTLKWTMRDHEWLASVSGWKEFSLGGDDEEIEEEKVFVPGTALPALVELLLSLCKLIDMATSLTPNTEFLIQTKNVAIKTTYCSIASFYKQTVENVLDKYPMLASPALLLLLFDIHFLQTLFNNAIGTDGIKDELSVLATIEETLLTAIDPVDWTLAESYMKIALNEFIASTALLLSPLLAKDYKPDARVAMKSLSRNANVLFTPIEKIASYPVSSQPMQLLLQSQMKSI